MEVTNTTETPERASSLIACAAMGAMGLGVSLPGALLPMLLVRWSMSDQQAGLMFFLFFIGSTSGALLSRGSMNHSIVRACAIASFAAVGLALASRGTAFAGMLLYGLGLGIGMTSITVLQSRRHPLRRAAQMARLNLVWAIGALLGPLVLLRGAATLGPAKVLLATAALFLLMAALVLALVKDAEAPARSMSGAWQQARAVPLALAVMVPLSVGIESAMGGWLATFSKRQGEALGVTIGAASFFWAGVLLSRLLQSHPRVAASTTRPLLIGAPIAIAIGLVIALATPVGFAILAGALLMGLGIGPTYPLLLALTLKHGEAGNAVFVLAGCGAALLPLLTGLVSGWSGSLRAGLGVPLAGAVVMAVSGVLAARHEAVSG